MTNFVFGQNNPSTIKPQSDTTSIDTIKQKRNTFLTIFSGKPGKAALYGFVVPGAGHIYNKKYWKLPIVYGIEGYLLYSAVSKSRKFSELDVIYKDLVNGGTHPQYNVSNIIVPRNTARQDKEYGWVFFIIGHIVTTFDAYVDRHLLDFDMKDDISIKYFPSQDIGQFSTVGFSIAIR